MVYGHRWHRPASLPEAPFARVAADAQVIVGALTGKGLQLCSPDGEGPPILDSDIIALNGNRECGHTADYRICRTWPADHAGGIAYPGQDVTVAQRGDTTLVSMRYCNGNCSWQGFFLPRVLDLRYADRDDENLFGGECATDFRPYDLAVTSLLLSVKRHFGDTIGVFTDATEAHLWDAQILCERLLDFGLGFTIIAGELVRKSTHCAETNTGENNNTNVS